jgi:hypothetical protein
MAVRNIKIFLGKEWFIARDYQIEAYTLFEQNNTPYNNNTPYEYNKDGIKFTIKRCGDKFHGPTYMIKEDGTRIPIFDFKDVKVFLLDMNQVNWYSAHDYQIFAYINFLYSELESCGFKSLGTEGLDNYTEIPIDSLQAGIIFRMSRNDNGTIFYEKNDTNRTRVRISDNEEARRGYLAYYHRMTAPIHMTVVPINNSSSASNVLLDIPSNVVVTKTLDDELMCSICNDNKQNIKFVPCGHTYTCSECYQQLVKKYECPVCKQIITQLVKYDP